MDGVEGGSEVGNGGKKGEERLLRRREINEGNSKNQRNQFNWGASIRKRKLSSKRSKGKKERRKKGYED